MNVVSLSIQPREHLATHTYIASERPNEPERGSAQRFGPMMYAALLSIKFRFLGVGGDCLNSGPSVCLSVRPCLPHSPFVALRYRFASRCGCRLGPAHPGTGTYVR